MTARQDRVRADLMAGLVVGLAAVPDALASATLAGVNPVHGLVAVMIGMPIAALATGSVFLVVTTTSALALMTGSALAPIAPEARMAALALLTVMVGVLQLALGLARAGFLTHYVSNAVMTGFFAAVALRIVLGQLPAVAGATGTSLLHVPTLAVGLLTLAIILILERTRWSGAAMLVALAAATLAAGALPGVPRVGDAGAIPRAVPAFAWPDLTSLPQLAFSALALALVGLIQGAGVGQTFANPDGRFAEPSRDFTGQGLANLFSGLSGGMPIGASVSATALSVGAGACTRLAPVAAAVVVVGCVLALGSVLSRIPTAVLAALLLLVGVRAIRLDDIRAVWHARWSARAALVFTFVATMLLPIPEAVTLAIAVSCALELSHAAARVRIVELVPGGDGTLTERQAPTRLEPNAVTILLAYGTLSFAGARRFEASLPDARGATRTVVLLALRGRAALGSTMLRAISRYARTLQQERGRLILVGVSRSVHDQLTQTGVMAVVGARNVFDETPSLGEALRRALQAARSGTDTIPPAPGA